MNCHLYRKRKLVLNRCSRETWQRGGDVWNWGVTIVFKVMISHYRRDTYIILLCRKHQGEKSQNLLVWKKSVGSMRLWKNEKQNPSRNLSWAVGQPSWWLASHQESEFLGHPIWELLCGNFLVCSNSMAHLSWAWREGLFWTCIAFIACLWLLLVRRPNKCSWNWTGFGFSGNALSSKTLWTSCLFASDQFYVLITTNKNLCQFLRLKTHRSSTYCLGAWPTPSSHVSGWVSQSWNKELRWETRLFIWSLPLS